MQDLQIFNNDAFGEVRVASINNEPYFCLADVCKALELHSNVVKQRLDDDVCQTYPIVDALGRTQQATFVSEAGLYEVILRSDKPEAKVFRKWVTSDVLPSIRKTGQYSVAFPQTYIEALEQFVAQVKENERLAIENKAQEETISEQSKTIRTLDEEIDALTPTSKLTFSEVAKLINRSGISGIGRNKLLDFAREKGYLMKYHNEPYQSALDKFEFKTVNGHDGRKFKQPIVKRSFLKQFVREAIEYVKEENLLKVESLF